MYRPHKKIVTFLRMLTSIVLQTSLKEIRTCVRLRLRLRVWGGVRYAWHRCPPVWVNPWRKIILSRPPPPSTSGNERGRGGERPRKDYIIEREIIYYCTSICTFFSGIWIGQNWVSFGGGGLTTAHPSSPKEFHVVNLYPVRRGSECRYLIEIGEELCRTVL